MKPRLKLFRGLWNCYVPNVAATYCGIGFDPLGAWEDWADATRLQWRREGRA